MQIKTVTEKLPAFPTVFITALFLLHVFAFATGFNSFPLTDYSLYSQHQTLSDFGVYRILAVDEHGKEHSVVDRFTYKYSDLVYFSLQAKQNNIKYLFDQNRWIVVPPIEKLIDELKVYENLSFTPVSIKIVYTTAYTCENRICIHDRVILTHRYD